MKGDISLGAIKREMMADFSYGGKLKIEKGPVLDIKEDNHRGIDFLSKVAMCRNRTLENEYGNIEIQFFYDALMRITKKLRNGLVLVISSANPWVEACILAAGDETTTVHGILQYGARHINHKQVIQYTPGSFRSKFMKRTLPQFDAIVSYGVIAQVGLGVLPNDPLNPWADLQSIARAWCVAKPGAQLLIGVPGPDTVSWLSGSRPAMYASAVEEGKIVVLSNRVYGNLSYSHLLSNWKQVWRAKYGLQHMMQLEKVEANVSSALNNDPCNNFTFVREFCSNTASPIWAVRGSNRYFTPFNEKDLKATVHLWQKKRIESVPLKEKKFSRQDFTGCFIERNADTIPSQPENQLSKVNKKIDFIEIYRSNIEFQNKRILAIYPLRYHGMADQLLGIAGAFAIALLTGREFQICVPSGMRTLQEVFESPLPNLFRSKEEPWIEEILSSASYVPKILDDVRVNFNDSVLDSGQYSLIYAHNRPSYLQSPFLFNSIYNNHSVATVFLMGNRGPSSFFEYNHLKVLLAKTKLSPSNIFGSIISFLFYPKPEIFNGLEKVALALKNNRMVNIIIQVRTGDSTLMYNKTAPPYDQFVDFFKCAESIEKFSSKATKWFFFTDSVRLRKEAVEKIGNDKLYTTTDMEIEHSASTEVSKEGFQRSAAEWWLMGQGDYFVLSQYSGFGKTAAMRKIRSSPQNIYLLSSEQSSQRVNSLKKGLCNQYSYSSIEKLKKSWSGI